jgi:threonine dehydrogenase-like Zn-dependent dehydrogenase
VEGIHSSSRSLRKLAHVAQRIVFTGKAKVELESYDPEPIRPGTVRIQAVTSLISTGTEGICFLRNFEAGTHWDDWVSGYPFRTGYIMVGKVGEIGPLVTELTIGQVVTCRVPHASDQIVDANICTPVPEAIAPELAVWFALATVGFMGVKNARIKFGDSVAIVGAGPVGQMLVRWSAAIGARQVVAIDPVEWRLELARLGGATATCCGTAEAALEPLKELCSGLLPDIVADTTGHPEVFAQCLRLPRDRGRVLLLGDTGEPSKQHLTKDVLRRGLEIVGAHIYHEEGKWTQRAIVELFFDLHLRGRFSLEGLNTHAYRPEQCVEAYAHLISGREKTMGIRFMWE